VSKIATEILQQRVSVVEEELRASNIDAMLLFASGSVLGNQSGTHAYLRFLCDFNARNTSTILLLQPGCDPVVLTANRHVMRPRTAEKELWFGDVRHVAQIAMGTEAASAILKRKNSIRRIALVGYEEIPAPVWSALAEKFPGVEWIRNFGTALDRHRLIKGETELKMHRDAASICDRMFEELSTCANSGLSAYGLKCEMENVARQLGCDYCDTWLTAGPQADAFRYHREECKHIPEHGDQLLAGVMLTYEGHWGHSVRMGSVGTPRPEHKALYAICREMFDVALETLRPGEDLCLVNDAMDDVLHRYYREEQVRRTRSGHGLGYAYEDPIASRAFPNSWESSPPSDRVPIETLPGMLLELHPHLFVPGVGGAMIGDMVLITDHGPELVTHYPRDLINW
jgi:Xaa-Pro dipeptidase